MYLASIQLHNETLYAIVAILLIIVLLVWLVQHFR